MLSQVVSYPAWTLPRVAKQNSKERLTRGRWDKGRLEVHILLGLFTNEHIKTFHVRSEGRVDLPFLFPDKARSGNDHPCPWYDTCTVEHGFVILRAGSVGVCFFLTDRPNEEGLLVLIEV